MGHIRRSRKRTTLHTFTAEASAALARARLAPPTAGRRLRGAWPRRALPTESEEVWRYTPIDEPGPRRLRARRPATGPSRRGDQLLAAVTTALGPVAGQRARAQRAGRRLHRLGAGGSSPSGGPTTCPARPRCSGRCSRAATPWCGSTTPSRPTRSSSTSPTGVPSTAPVLVVHWCDRGVAAFPRTVRARRGGRAVVASSRSSPGPTAPSRALVVPVTELARRRRRRRSPTSPCRSLGDAAWSIARLAGRGAARRPRCARSPSASAPPTTGCGPTSRSRGRTPAARSSPPISATGPRCTTSAPCRTTWRRGPTSELLCQGAVAGTSRSVYSGLIRVHRGAVRSDARQTNHNLVLDEGAHADSVPNLDILENDVRCSPRLDGGPDRRGPALLHRVARRGARGGRGPHRARLLRRHHRPLARPRGRPVAPARGARPPRRSRWAAGPVPAGG